MTCVNTVTRDYVSAFLLFGVFLEKKNKVVWKPLHASELVAEKIKVLPSNKEILWNS